MGTAVVTGPAEIILQFWFGNVADDGTVDEQHSKRWFEKDPEFDEEIRNRFEGMIERAASGELTHWRVDPHGALAFVLLCDQMSRNMFRDTSRAFAFDEIALDASRAALAAGYQDWLRDLEAAFLFMPFMHSEELTDQQKCVELFEARAQSAEPGSRVREMLERSVDFAKRHMAIIERFGRFPHRNAILGRESTEEELAFLQQPGSSF